MCVGMYALFAWDRLAEGRVFLLDQLAEGRA